MGNDHSESWTFVRCTNKCQEHKGRKPGAGSMYANGQKCCSYCAVFMYLMASVVPVLITISNTDPGIKNTKLL